MVGGGWRQGALIYFMMVIVSSHLMFNVKVSSQGYELGSR